VDSILIQAGGAATFVKILVDVFRMIAPNAPAWVFALAALALSPVFLIAMMALGPPIVFDQQTLATIFLGSVVCAGVASGASANQRKADEMRRVSGR
jgi:uncharacterized membrane protein